MGQYFTNTHLHIIELNTPCMVPIFSQRSILTKKKSYKGDFFFSQSEKNVIVIFYTFVSITSARFFKDYFYWLVITCYCYVYWHKFACVSNNYFNICLLSKYEGKGKICELSC